ncbi:SelT-like protein [Strongyloides ratti]|uniref:SelT-like protein n=1 Tax=Strongyloides ratti TaxID=34506 RepID=A0A090MRP2_STRRB|nr:SelT-like protein [Strongyloides ratti]CEF60908.1 SelT-like protein [Strongyloides ratti]
MSSTSSDKKIVDEEQDEFEAFQSSVTDQEDEIDIRDPSSHLSPNHKDPEVMPIHSKKLPPVHFKFCVSCGYKQAFEQFSSVIREKYPNIEISGENYPPVYWKSLIAQIVGIAKFAFIFLIISGKDPLLMIGISVPSLSNWYMNNKISSCMMIFMLSNLVEGMMMSTGAFEIFLGEEKIWSKIESGRVPSPNELLTILAQNLEINGVHGSNSFSQFNFNE